ncbi:LysR family transcriptional regulator [Pseudomonas benzenivorans]|uniref:LysR family transcriptional regulator n=1 Tax=Pseudomonas benzenivorans TaxID=556533 RepID=UPI0035145759
MDRYQELRVFKAVAEARGLAAAARRLGLSAPTVTRAIGALEGRLGVVLLARGPRGVTLTEAGEGFLVDCRRILAQVAEAEASACGLHVEARGRLHLVVPLLFGQQVLTPILLDYLGAYPEVQIFAQYQDGLPNLQEEGVDVAIAVGALADSSLFARRVGAVRRIVCASPAYLAEQGEPRQPAELTDHRLIHSSADSRLPEWRFVEQGRWRTLGFVPRLSCATDQAAIAAACGGAGLTRCMSYQVHGLLQQGQLRRVLSDFEPPELPVQLVYREGRRAAARVRSFVDFAVKRLREHPALG